MCFVSASGFEIAIAKHIPFAFPVAVHCIGSALTDWMHQAPKWSSTLEDDKVQMIRHDRPRLKQCIRLLQRSRNDLEDFRLQAFKPELARVCARRDVECAAGQVGSLSSRHSVV
jgi:hypothetical protein